MAYSGDSAGEGSGSESGHRGGGRSRFKHQELDEEEQKRREMEQKKRLERRIEIAEKGFVSRYHVWMDSPAHNHDSETFNNEKDSLYGKLRYNLSESEKKSERKEHKRKKDKKKKKKSKKSKKAKKSKKSSSSSSSSSESEVEALEFNIDTIKKNINTSDEEEADKMIIDNQRKVGFYLSYRLKIGLILTFSWFRPKNANEHWKNWLNSAPNRTIC